MWSTLRRCHRCRQFPKTALRQTLQRPERWRPEDRPRLSPHQSRVRILPQNSLSARTYPFDLLPSCGFDDFTHRIENESRSCVIAKIRSCAGSFLKGLFLPSDARRRDGRVAEGARLESVFTRKGNVGSNPTLSASSFSLLYLTCCDTVSDTEMR